MPTSYDYAEMIVLRLLELNSLIPHYWAEFFVLAFQLLDTDDQIILRQKIREIEHMCFDDNLLKNRYICTDCRFKFKTETDWFDLKGCPRCENVNVKCVEERQSIYDVEMAMESNMDFTSFFSKNGRRVSKIEIERRLSQIKRFVFNRIRELASSRRFKRFR